MIEANKLQTKNIKLSMSPLKKDNNYLITFVDPRGTEHLKNPISKIDGFNEIFIGPVSQEKSSIHVSLWYYNPNKPGEFTGDYEKYWTDDLDKVFGVL